MPVGARRPFTEIFEVAQLELVREASSNAEPKYRGCVNQVYMNDMPALLPERYIRKQGFITTLAAYSAGTITVASLSSNILGTSTSWTSANSDGLLLSVNGYNHLYRVSFTNSTVLALKNSLAWTESSGSGLGYNLLQDRYVLPSDFNYMAQDNPENPNIVSYMVNGYNVFLTPITNNEYDRIIVPTTSQFFSSYTIKFDAGNPYLHIWPFPANVDNLSFWYIPSLSAMVEYTTGTVTFTTGTAVVGAGSPVWTSLNTAYTYFIRNDADGTGSASLWTQIASFTNATALTLSSNFAGTSGTGITYTISQISQWPARFDDGMLYKTCLIVDPDNAQNAKWNELYMEAIDLDKTTESKRKRDSQLKSFSGQRYRG